MLTDSLSVEKLGGAESSNGAESLRFSATPSQLAASSTDTVAPSLPQGPGANLRQQGRAEKTGTTTYGGAKAREGGIVLKDFHDCYEGDGWVAGTVVSASATGGGIDCIRMSSVCPKEKRKNYCDQLRPLTQKPAFVLLTRPS